MPIRFRCSNEACAKRFVVADGAAGRAGKCPVCGTAFRVPEIPPQDLAEGPRQERVIQEPRPALVTSTAAKPSVPIEDTWEEDHDIPGRPTGRVMSYQDHDVPSRPIGRVVSFGAIGLGWQLLREEFGTWVLTTFVMCLALMGLGIVIQLLTAGLIAAEFYLFGPHPVPISMFASLFINIAIQAVIAGGLIRMALKQIDGGKIGVADLFSVGGPGKATRLAMGMVVVGLLGALCTIFLVIPGLIFYALSMFTFHLIIDGDMGVGSALATSLRTLRHNWFSAILFLIVVVVISSSGMLLLGLGLLFTIPWYILSITAQYRRSFAPGAKTRVAVVEDPYAEVMGIPLAERTVPRAPIGAWVLMTFGLVAPVALFALVIATTVHVMEEARRRNADRPRVATKGANPAFEAFSDDGDGARIQVQTIPGRQQVHLETPRTALQRLRGDTTAQIAACNWLAINPPDANEPLRGPVAQALEPLLKQPGLSRQAAIRALAPWATTDNVPALAAASGSGDPVVSRLAKEILEKLQDGAEPGARRAIADALQRGRGVAGTDTIEVALAQAKGSDTSGRISALQALRKGPVDPKYQGKVASAMLPLLSDPNAVVRANAVGALGVWARTSDYPTICAVLDDETEFVRQTAIEALAGIKEPQVISKVVSLAENPRLINNIRSVVRDYGSDAEPALLDLLDSRSEQARRFACQMLGEVGTEKCLPALQRAQQDTDRNVQTFARRAVQALERRLGLAPSTSPKTQRKSPNRTPRKPGAAQTPARKKTPKRDSDPNSDQ